MRSGPLNRVHCLRVRRVKREVAIVEAAAVKVQSIWRGNNDRALADVKAAAFDASLTLQKCARAWRVRAARRAVVQSAVKLQSFSRGKSGRMAAKVEAEARRADRAAAEHAASIRLQSAARGRSARRVAAVGGKLSVEFRCEGDVGTFDGAGFAIRLAAALGVEQRTVHLRLAAGSVIVRATVVIEDPAQLAWSARAARQGVASLSASLGVTLLHAPTVTILTASAEEKEEARRARTMLAEENAAARIESEAHGSANPKSMSLCTASSAVPSQNREWCWPFGDGRTSPGDANNEVQHARAAAEYEAALALQSLARGRSARRRVAGQTQIPPVAQEPMACNVAAEFDAAAISWSAAEQQLEQCQYEVKSLRAKEQRLEMSLT